MDIEALPQIMLERLNEIKNAKLIIQNKEYIFETPKEIIKNLKKISILMEISSIFKNVYITKYILLAESGINIFFIFTKTIIERLKNEYKEIFYKYIKMNNVIFFIVDDIQIASCTISDYFISLSLFTKKKYYINHELISYEKEAIKWGQDLFVYYRNLSQIFNFN